jgi:putative transposase
MEPVYHVRVLRMRVKDKHAKWLVALAHEVNTVWNFCNDLQIRVFARERRILSGFDFWPYLKGCTRGDCALQLPIQTVQDTAEQYARSRAQHGKVKLAWRKGSGTRRSLGWIPFKVRTLRYRAGQVCFAGTWLSLWDSFGLGQYELRAGSFSEDARGRWYLNVCVEVPESQGPVPPRSLPALELGIDLGLKSLVTLSDGTAIDAPRFYRNLEPALATAQRARKRNRARAIQSKIRNRRNDFLHQLSTALVRKSSAIFVGNISASKLSRTKHAKSVADAGWSTLRTMLRYKCASAGVWFDEVNEAYSTQTCSRCQSRTGPRGREGLGIREWTCKHCGAVHDRDVNAAQNILAVGHGRLAEGILSSSYRQSKHYFEPGEDVNSIPVVVSRVASDP